MTNLAALKVLTGMFVHPSGSANEREYKLGDVVEHWP